MCVHAYVKTYDIKFSKGQAFTYTILFTFLNIYVKYKNKILVSIQCQKESNSDMICTTINIKNVKTHKKLERQKYPFTEFTNLVLHFCKIQKHFFCLFTTLPGKIS